MEVYKHDIELDAMKKIESRRANRIQGAYSNSNSNSNSSNSNSNSNRNRDSLQDRRVGNEREREREGMEGGAYSYHAPYNDPYSRNVPPSSSGAWDNNRDRDSGKDIRRGDGGRESENGGGGGREGGRGGGRGAGSYARLSSSSLRQGNINDDKVSKLDQTLMSDR